MKIAVTGASGLVGRFLTRGLTAAGHEVHTMPGWRLGQPVPLTGCDALVHAAFAHVPGKYRGGEGDDPAGFRALNVDGTRRLFDEAQRDGVGRVVFLSSRAVYDAQPAGTPLPDGTAAAPESLYGRVKAEVEADLTARTAPGFSGASIRATGIYGPGPDHKWQGLFADYLSGRPIATRRATELHGDDLTAAVLLLLASPETGAFNASDLLLDRRDLLAEVARVTGCPHAPPSRCDARVSVMTCERLTGMGWRPCGWDALSASVPRLLSGES